MNILWHYICTMLLICVPMANHIDPVGPFTVQSEKAVETPVTPSPEPTDVVVPEPTPSPSETPSEAPVEVSEPEPIPSPTSTSPEAPVDTPEPEPTVVDTPSPTEVPSPKPSAPSVDTSVWDRVASCESNGNWSIKPSDNLANYNFYGGLQFSEQSWYGAGGGRYAPRADLATKEEQIAIARRLLAMQGPNAWPHCGPAAGLTKVNGGATMEFVVG